MSSVAVCGWQQNEDRFFAFFEATTVESIYVKVWATSVC